MRLYLPSGDHVFRAAFIDDDFVKTLSEKDAYNNKKNKFSECDYVRRVRFRLTSNRPAARRS